MSKGAFKVSELNNYIKKIISMDYILRDISLIGEVTNLKKHSNGNYYFSLKDEFSRINAIIYSDEKPDFELFDGAKVLAKGAVTYYERDGQFTFYVKEISLDGKGSLYLQFLDLKKKLEAEGLFLNKYKKEIPKFPNTIGLITSTSGAAIKDVINILKNRNRYVDVLVYPSLMQGIGASENIISGIEYFNSANNVETIIIARGGGSYEDLFVFNDEAVARSIFNSKIPIISAVGHEIDFTIADFVADLRAATPTNAAELVTISEDEIISDLNYKKTYLDNLIHRKINDEKLKILNIYRSISLKNQSYKINDLTRDLLNKEKALNISLQKIISNNKGKLYRNKLFLNNFKLSQGNELKNYLYRLNKINSNLNYKINYEKRKLNYYYLKLMNSVNLSKERQNLEINYLKLKSAFDKINKIDILNADGKNIKSIRNLNLGDRISLRFKDGKVDSIIENIEARSD
ncbi:exodeoxyribonuclease VII large subunit [Peptoniphilus sp. MSJ-1]|uniref:Exodeoxyribonuclease 7 large subunit n=1 Tax=Peptoniphilus ovalis TaxID=2841503 RepID=A0ABS6FIW7_9FIRM|nr:exodeoxyribonuclease VII large subunit [Peptoniphilus ovalis]MBU5669181.1 exodeoxyribonuclease VII large subunit [Peptoniphilus ovalis]